MTTSIDVVVLHTGEIRAELAMALLMMTSERRYRLAISFNSAQPTSNNRNRIVKEFLANERHADWLMMLDSDTIPSGDCLSFVEKGYDVVGFVSPLWKAATSPQEPVVWNVQLKWGIEKFSEINLLPDPEEEPMIRVASVGTGAILVSRKVLEHPDMRWPFRDVFDEDGLRTVGHDLNFCHRARRAGFEVWVSLANPADHIKPVSLISVAKMLRRSKDAVPE